MKNINYSLLALCVFTARLTALGASIGDSLAVAALAGLYGYSLFLSSKKQPPLSQEVMAELELVKGAISSLKLAKSMNRNG